MELRINDYVRTENGLIGKIICFKGDMVETDNKRLITYKSNHSECEIKERPIDLIEVGDYVNGYLVIEKDINNELRYIDLKDRNMKYVKYLDIKSIVTKEQFSSMEYKIGDK